MTDLTLLALNIASCALGAALFEIRDLQNKLKEARVTQGPYVHEFPNFVRNRHVSLNCVVSATPIAWKEKSPSGELRDSGIVGIETQRVGAVAVVLGEHGFQLRWEANEPADERFFALTPDASSPPPFASLFRKGQQDDTQ